jgi:hypothetical protein
MSGAMLSRFDLVFLLVDQPDEALDHSLSEHVLALHSGRPPACPAAAMLLGHTPSPTDGRCPCPGTGFAGQPCRAARRRCRAAPADHKQQMNGRRHIPPSGLVVPGEQ